MTTAEAVKRTMLYKHQSTNCPATLGESSVNKLCAVFKYQMRISIATPKQPSKVVARAVYFYIPTKQPKKTKYDIDKNSVGRELKMANWQHTRPRGTSTLGQQTSVPLRGLESVKCKFSSLMEDGCMAMEPVLFLVLQQFLAQERVYFLSLSSYGLRKGKGYLYHKGEVVVLWFYFARLHDCLWERELCHTVF